MKKLLMVVLLACIAVPEAPAQDDDMMIPPIPPKRSKAAKVGAFGGFMPGWLFLDTKPLNQFIQPAGGAPIKDEGVFLSGGGGAAYIMFIPNLRVGGMGMSGSRSSTSLSGTGIRRDVKLDVGFGGVTIEYVIPIVERLDIAVGGMLGAGGLDIILRQDVGGNKTWQQEWGQWGSGDYQSGTQIPNITRKLSGNFWVWVPSVNVEYAILGWLGARLGASYVGMSSPSWELDDKYDLLGVPSAISGKGVMVSMGLFVGTF